jgi:MATE family multidrug resistance protein
MSSTTPLARPIRPIRPGRRRGGILLRHESGSLLRIAGPIVLSQLGSVGMNTIDTIMVGPLGAESLAAAGLGASLHMAAIMVCTGTLLGMGPLVSQAFGAGERHECRHVLVQGLWLALLLSVPMIVLNIFGEEIALALGQDPRVAALVGGYMIALAWGVVPLLLFMSFRQFLEGMGLAKPAMAITFLGLAVNLVGNRIFIYGVAGWVAPMGVVGSGWATTMVRWTMLAAMAGYILRNPDLHPFRGVRWGVEGGLLRRIVGIGAPTGAQTGLEVGVFAFAAVMMGWFGALELGTHQVAINIASTTFMVALGISIAGAIRVGQHIGARSPRGVHRAVILTYALAVGSMALFALVFLVAPAALLGLYTSDPEIIALGTLLLYAAAAFQVFDGAQVAGFSVLRGAADTRVPMLCAAFAYWVVGAPVAYLLGFRSELGPLGVWIGLSAGLAVAAVLLLLRVRRVLWGEVRPAR